MATMLPDWHSEANELNGELDFPRSCFSNEVIALLKAIQEKTTALDSSWSDLLPTLADALEETGFTRKIILGYLRRNANAGLRGNFCIIITCMYGSFFDHFKKRLIDFQNED